MPRNTAMPIDVNGAAASPRNDSYRTATYYEARTEVGMEA